MRPEISIIVPVYNAEMSVARLIDSILSQSYENFELILIDDCSQDNSRNICEEYLKIDKRIQLICQDKNQGVSCARNKGLDIAKGNYVMFADSDDVVAENWCKALYDAALQHPKDLVSSNIYIVDGDICESKVKGDKASCLLTGYYELFSMGISGYLVNKIFSLQIVNDHNIRFNKELYMGEDVAFVIDYFKHLFGRFFFVNTPLYYYYTNPQSITHTYHEDDLVSHLYLYGLRLPLISKKDVSEYCDTYFPFLISLFSNIFDTRCKKSFFQKMRYNQQVISSKEFRFCVANISGNNESAGFLRLVKTHNYYLLWAYQKLTSMKGIIKKHITI